MIGALIGFGVDTGWRSSASSAIGRSPSGFRSATGVIAYLQLLRSPAYPVANGRDSAVGAGS